MPGKDPKLNGQLTKLAMEDPQQYARTMKMSGREKELTTSDKIRASTAGFMQKLGLGKKKQGF